MSKKVAHTPGPWRIGFTDGSGETYITAGDHGVVKDLNNIVTVVSGTSDDWGIKQGVLNPADAHLIAAAPEMLEALEQLNSEIRGFQNVPSCRAMEMVRAAIQKAKGGQ